MAETNRVARAWAAVLAALQGRRLRRWARIGLYCLVGLAVASILAVGVGLVWLHGAAQAALPVLDGTVHVAGLSAPVVVRRDGHGVPHIEARNETDLFMAQGYVTAQDRLWQMDALRRNASGELAEILGPTLVEHDKEQRVLGFRRTAERVYGNLPATDRARVDAYARGVNLFIEQHRDTLPPEFRLLAYKPRPWTGVDSVSVGMLLVQALDTHWSTKLTREHVMAKLKHDQQLEEDLYPVGSWRDRPPTGIANDVNPPPAPVAKSPKDVDGDDDEDDDTPTESRLLPRALGLPAADLELAGLGTDPRGRPACPGCQPGSNNWVVSGAHTASGKPLLANDMHLGITAPNIWYMADLKAPGYHAEGVTLPGMPFVIEGHNEHVAWGITALMGDVQDLYIEKVDGKGNYERNDESWVPLRVDHQIIKVRFGHNVKLDVEFTDHGPLITPILHKEKRAIALKWTLYDPQLNSMPVYRVNTAANWAEFRAALADWSWPTLNIVYADDQGHIAYHAVGRIPIRNSYYRGGGYPLPFDPMNLRTEWRGAFLLYGNGYSSADYVPFDDMPNAFDPPSGFLATANARVTTEKNKYPITFEWVDPYRVERIYKALEGRGGLVPKDMLAVQTDVYSEVDQELGQRIAYAIEHTQGVDERLQRAAALLRDWDGRLTADSAAASIVTTTRKALWPLILEPKLGKAWEEYQWLEKDFAEEEIVMRAKPQWLPKNYKNWDELLTAAVRKGMDDGKAPGDVRKWTYGSWHVVDIEHALSKFLPVVGRIAGTGEQPQTGDTTTVKQVGRAFGPSQRFTMDWSNVDGSTQNIVLGESGNPYSPYYRDQWNDWYGGTTFAFAFTDKAVAAETRNTLRLEP